MATRPARPKPQCSDRLTVLGLDLATVRFGWALNPREDSATLKYGSLALRKTGQPTAVAGIAFMNWLRVTIREERPHVIVREAAWVGKDTSQATAEALMGICFMTDCFAESVGIRIYKANVRSVRKHFVGRTCPVKRDAAKLAVQRTCDLLGWPVEGDEDAADAIAIHSYGMACLKQPPIREGGLFMKL